MRAFHENWALVVVAVNILAGLWGLVATWMKREPGRAFWAAIIAGQAALALQVTIGVTLMRRVKPPSTHVFYGFMLLFVAVLAWTYRGQTSRRAVAVMAGVALFVGVVGVRAMVTA